MVSPAVLIRHVSAGEADRLREFRLASLASDPDAFGSTYAHELEYPVERWQQWAAGSEEGSAERTFVAVGEADDWRGMAVVRLHDETPRFAGLYAMWIAPTARGLGLATALCDAGAAWAAERGCPELRLWVEHANLPAQRAYERAGFEPTGQDSWTRPDGVTQIHTIMTRQLRAG